MLLGDERSRFLVVARAGDGGAKPDTARIKSRATIAVAFIMVTEDVLFLLI